MIDKNISLAAAAEINNDEEKAECVSVNILLQRILEELRVLNSK